MREMLQVLFTIVLILWLVSTAIQWTFSDRTIGIVLSDQWYYNTGK
ncbi:hypothetical protein LCGC14_1007550 [marine sediment metagenome]|uniref:Uncharacterized protein n=1 Tax=marine sediment metagenome TaxID=412755 RepID=A0A0F9NMR4_9ZZZZ